MSGRTVVVGAGLSGLAAAHALAERGGDVVVLEAAPRAGGVVRTERRGGFLLELGPNTVRPTPELMRLISQLGLSGEVGFADPRAPRYVDFAGRLHALPGSPGALLASRLLTPAGKLRLLLEPFVRRGGIEGESVRDFVTRRLGEEAAERLVEPFVGGVFAGDASRLAIESAFPLLSRLERDHGSLLRGMLASARPRQPGPRLPKGLLSFREGLSMLPAALARRLGAALRTACGPVSFSPRAGRWIVADSRAEFEADRVILAVPADAASALVRGFAPDAARALDGIPYPPLAVLHLAWPESALLRPLEGFGHLVAPSPTRRILGAVWSSSLFPGRAPAGQVLLTVFVGGRRDPEALALNDGELVALAARDLESEGLVRGVPEPILVTRWPRAIPQYEGGHAQRLAVLAETERRLPGLRFAGNYRGGIAVGDVIREGLAAAESA
jgi:oxygen-dependent protoporphyrinogen oxidase